LVNASLTDAKDPHSFNFCVTFALYNFLLDCALYALLVPVFAMTHTSTRSIGDRRARLLGIPVGANRCSGPPNLSRGF
jgi:hypothetical protein